MRGVNFIYFFTVQGFFIGILFALFRAETPNGILYYTFMITGFFYLFAHLSVAFYFRTLTLRTDQFPKQRHEHELDRIMHEIDKREKSMEHDPQIDMDAMTGKIR